MSPTQITLLIFLSLLWGGSFLFAGIAVTELHPLYVVLVRVSLAAITLLPFMLMRHKLPSNFGEWFPFIGMGLLNNAIPFTFIFFAQTYISVGLASIINSFTPIASFVILAFLASEPLSKNKIVGSFLGIFGVIILVGQKPFADMSNSAGILMGIVATVSYGFAALWGKKYLATTPPLKSATCQLISSSVILILVILTLQPKFPSEQIGIAPVVSLIMLAVFSTALAYVVFFRILTISGAGNVMLVTLLIPFSGSVLGWLVLDERLQTNHIIGSFILGLSLITIDGRLSGRLKRMFKF